MHGILTTGINVVTLQNDWLYLLCRHGLKLVSNYTLLVETVLKGHIEVAWRIQSVNHRNASDFCAYSLTTRIVEKWNHETSFSACMTTVW